MKVPSLVAITLIACFSYACNPKMEDKGIEVDQLNRDMDKIADNYQIADSTASPKSDVGDKKQSPPNIDWDKKIIRTANMSIEVKDYKAYSSSLSELVKKFGGYIANEQETKNEIRIENRVKIKVPVAQFQDLMTSISDSGEKIIDKQVSSDDVTAEVIDTKARIEAKKKIRQRYLDFLQQAKTMADILSIQAQVNEEQVQIEMAEGRVQYLTHSAAYSTIDLHFFQLLNPNKVEGQPTFANKLSEAFMGGWEVLKDLFIVLITIWPLWLLALAGYIIYKKRRVGATK